MICQRCGSKRVLHVSGHASDLFSYSISEKEGSGYLPHDFGLGGGDDIELDMCLQCGQVQGNYPMPPTKLETKKMEPEDFKGDKTYSLQEIEDFINHIKATYGVNAALRWYVGRYDEIKLEVG